MAPLLQNTRRLWGERGTLSAGEGKKEAKRAMGVTDHSAGTRKRSRGGGNGSWREASSRKTESIPLSRTIPWKISHNKQEIKKYKRMESLRLTVLSRRGGTH